MLLAIDTATDWASIAIYDEDNARILHEETWWAQRRHTTSLLPRIDAAMRGLGLSSGDLSGVAVAIGPGSYTGLRVGLSLAKGLSLALGVPLAGIPTLDAVAYPHRGRAAHLCAIIQAGRTRVCWAIYPPADPLTPVGGYHLDTVVAVVEALRRVEGNVYVCGEVTPEHRWTFEEALGERVMVASPAAGLRRAGSVAELGFHRFMAGISDDPATLTPIYLRHPESTTP